VHPGKPRGYAFIEFEHKNDMKNAYKLADGRKVEGKRVTVDVERGRTVPNWCAAPAIPACGTAPRLNAVTCPACMICEQYNR
jgi:RNA recognition motif-containing protein